MTVYVDNMRAKFGRMIMCHMSADTLDELHSMADQIGIARKWFQCPPKASGPHYDIALSKKTIAIEKGAEQVTMKHMAVVTTRLLVEWCEEHKPDSVQWAKDRRDRIDSILKKRIME